MRRIVVVGSYGAGKSTLAARLGSVLGLEVHHLDAVRWLPGWRLRPLPEWRRILDELVANDSWIVDGNFEHTLEPRLRRADTVIVLDFPTLISLWRVGLRRLRGGVRPDLAPGLDERPNLRFLQLVFAYRRRVRPVILELVERYRKGRQVLVLHGPREVAAFVDSVRRSLPVPGSRASSLPQSPASGALEP
jgi:adenylate kinase family enzyme